MTRAQRLTLLRVQAARLHRQCKALYQAIRAADPDGLRTGTLTDLHTAAQLVGHLVGLHRAIEHHQEQLS